MSFFIFNLPKNWKWTTFFKIKKYFLLRIQIKNANILNFKALLVKIRSQWREKQKFPLKILSKTFTQNNQLRLRILHFFYIKFCIVRNYSPKKYSFSEFCSFRSGIQKVLVRLSNVCSCIEIEFRILLLSIWHICTQSFHLKG